ncbi:MAG: glycosyltransferase family 2 protein [Algibacter sp.]|uniref:glycosyltransferase family 2 protein n=1 Tax=Algibacter sp. TaxID=1872428 RepID=UPI00262C134E|nr:glycosyltransferase family 2 protein [Algibacter sp.]MDG1730035.1 glycosyltransferase family 2 protein [Algibacter sp.]MDG2178342.1 glycosyltransferase family 2 protein [Algibacter sp.]
MPFFSVIIPLFNKEEYIEETLLSVLNQTFTDFEIIVVNDASTDKSLNKAKTVQEKRIKYFENEKNLGLSATRNRGISLAKGEIIALLDADDIWLPDFLENIKLLHKKFPEASIYGTDYLEKYDNKTVLEPQKNIPKNLKNKYFLIDDFFNANMYQCIFCPSSLAFKKNISKNQDVFNPNITYAEDIDFYIRFGFKFKTAYCYKASLEKNFNVPSQMTRKGISEETIPDLDYFENWTKDNNSLKKYLDLYRYIFAYQYKMEKSIKKKRTILKNINYNNLSLKQRFLLKSPRIIVLVFNKIKLLLLKYNIRVSSF